MNEMLGNIPGVVCHVDDMLVPGKNQEEHDARLNAVLQKKQTTGLTLNKDKCQFSCLPRSYLQTLIRRSHSKVKNSYKVTKLRRFMGMLTQLDKFSPWIAVNLFKNYFSQTLPGCGPPIMRSCIETEGGNSLSTTSCPLQSKCQD